MTEQLAAYPPRHRVLYAEDILRLNEGVQNFDTNASPPHLLPVALQARETSWSCHLPL